MTKASVEALFDRLATDDEFAGSLAAVKTDPVAVQALIAEAGFDVTPAEVSEAFLEHYGDQLTEEQLAAVAGGLTPDQANGVMVGSVAAGILIVGGAAAAAAAA